MREIPLGPLQPNSGEENSLILQASVALQDKADRLLCRLFFLQAIRVPAHLC